MLKALLFDVDGTLAETEEGHRAAFNAMFAAHGIPWIWSQAHYRALLSVTGGRERMFHHAKLFDPERLTAIEMRIDELHKAKNAHYADWVRASGGALRPGVRRLIEDATAAEFRLAIVTTTSRANIDALLSAAFPTGSPFEAQICGEDVRAKKPDPEAYLKALDVLDLPPSVCLAFEDTHNGVLAARRAGLRVVVTPSLYSAGEDFSDATWVVDDLEAGDVTVEKLRGLTD